MSWKIFFVLEILEFVLEFGAKKECPGIWKICPGISQMSWKIFENFP